MAGETRAAQPSFTCACYRDDELSAAKGMATGLPDLLAHDISFHVDVERGFFGSFVSRSPFLTLQTALALD